MKKSDDIKNLLVWLKLESIEYNQSVKLSDFSWFKTGGLADLIIFPKNKIQLTYCIKRLSENEIKFKVIGETSNLIFLDDISYGVFISTTKINSLIYDSEKRVISAECGVLLPELSRYALSLCVRGFEGFEGIPGTIGAAVFMNAGAYGDEIKDVIESVDIIKLNGEEKTYKLNDLGLSHRNSKFRSKTNDEIILSASFNAEKSDPLKIYNRMSLFHNKRHKYQEFMYPTLGSIYSGSIYRSLAKKDKWFKFVSAIYYLVFYKWKIFSREAPDNRKWLNDFTVSRFGFLYKNQPFSNKDMNTLINNGHHTDEILSYINQLNSWIENDVTIENEIVEKF